MVLLAGVSIAVGALAVLVGCATRSTAAREPDTGQIASAQRLVASIAPPGQATIDRYNTSCGIPDAVCITSPSATPPELFHEVIAMLQASGTTIRSAKCPDAAAQTAPGNCYGDLRFNNVHLAVTASGSTPSGVATLTWLTLQVDTGQASARTNPARPLGPWQSLKLTPADWKSRPSCTKPAAGGCNEYQATTAVRTTPRQTQTRLRASLTKAGYRVDSLRCYTAGQRVQGGCSLAASRFRTPDGRDQILIDATMQTDGLNTNIRLNARPGLL